MLSRKSFEACARVMPHFEHVSGSARDESTDSWLESNIQKEDSMVVSIHFSARSSLQEPGLVPENDINITYDMSESASSANTSFPILLKVSPNQLPKVFEKLE